MPPCETPTRGLTGSRRWKPATPQAAASSTGARRPPGLPPTPLLHGLALAASLLAGPAQAQGEDRLANLVNDYRAAPHACEGEQMAVAGSLTPSAALARVQLSAGADLQEALRSAGYQASRSRAISISGPPRADAVMALLESRYCRALLDPRYTEIGISRQGSTWRIVLAHPLFSADLGDWRQAGRKVLSLVNEARAQARTCGSQHFKAVGKLAWNDALAAASLAHSRDMARHRYFSHTAKDGSTPADRLSREGYRWHSVGENIAAGQGSPEKAVQAWLASPGHCANIMNPGFTETGAAYATNPGSEMIIYWTQDFASPRR